MRGKDQRARGRERKREREREMCEGTHASTLSLTYRLGVDGENESDGSCSIIYIHITESGGAVRRTRREEGEEKRGEEERQEERRREKEGSAGRSGGR